MYYGTTMASWECSKCVGVPVEAWEVYGEPDIFLLWHNLDTDSWSTPIHKWEDQRIDRLLAGKPDEDDNGLPYYLKDAPEYHFTIRTLQPDEVEKIKAASGKTIIVVPEGNIKNYESGQIYFGTCRPPEIIKNNPME